MALERWSPPEATAMRRSPSSWAGLALLIGAVAWCWFLAPSVPLASYRNPAYLALVVATVVVGVYAILVSLPRSPRRPELVLLSTFLAAMPVVYLWAALRADSRDGALVESIGLFIFGAWAVVGYRRSALWLGIGIAAHGLAWDAWHQGRTSFIEPWYPLACLVVDLAFGLAVAAQHLARKEKR
jgi:hypothetical protein